MVFRGWDRKTELTAKVHEIILEDAGKVLYLDCKGGSIPWIHLSRLINYILKIGGFLLYVNFASRKLIIKIIVVFDTEISKEEKLSPIICKYLIIREYVQCTINVSIPCLVMGFLAKIAYFIYVYTYILCICTHSHMCIK